MSILGSESLCSKCHLQCSIPAFEGLLPEPHNTLVRTLLYCTAEWHAFAKLRLHTESTLNHLEELTTRLGRLVRKFRDVTKSVFATFELPRETQARKRRSKGKETERTTHEYKPKAEDSQSLYLQMACTRRLCPFHPSFWWDRWIFDATGG